jgi:hypothetical protein
MAFTQDQVDHLQIGERFSALHYRESEGGIAYHVRGFDIRDDTQADLFEIRPDAWRFILHRDERWVYSANVHATKELAFEDLKSWLKGEGYCAVYEYDLPNSIESLVSTYVEQAVADGWRSIRVTKFNESESDDPATLRITIVGNAPSGEPKKMTFGMEQPASDLEQFFGGR